MAEGIELISEAIPSIDKANELLERLFEVANPSSVYSPPVESGDYKVITASEVRIGMGVGYGMGGGYGPGVKENNGEDESELSSGYGGGGGGGGVAAGRPVAAIEIGPQGVRVEPIVDPTKIAIAFFTTIISMIAMMSKMRRATRR